MTIHYVQIIRELFDRAPMQPKRSFCCTGKTNDAIAAWAPNVDIVESDDAVFIRVELAGVDRKDIMVRVANGEIIISGIRKENRPQKRMNFHQLEIHYGPIFKSIFIPESLEHNDTQAIYQDGVLEIIISKKSKVIEIPIEANEKND